MAKYFITIPVSPDKKTADRDQFRYYQKDGETIAVAVGVTQEVPKWVAVRAKEIGDVSDYIEA